MKRILITQLGFIGDVILSTPVIRAIRDKYPESELTVLTTKIAAPLIENHPAGVSVIAYDKRGAEKGIKGFFNLRDNLKEKKFDAVFSLHKSTRTTLLHFLTGIPLRYGFKESSLAFLYTKTVSRKSYPHDVERSISILKTIGLEVPDPKLEIGFSEEVKHKMSSLLPKGKYAVIAPGSVWKTKRWTIQGFADLAGSLRDDGYSVVLTGSKDEADLEETILRRFTGEINSFIGKLSLIESAYLISKASVIVSNDSSPLHLASTFNIPSVALFCATVPSFGFGPYKQPSRVLGVDNLYCRPCGRHGGTYCPTGTHACQTGIKVGDVSLAVKELVDSQI